IRGSDITDISWFGPDGKHMDDNAWGAGFVRCLGVRLSGDVIGDVDDRGEPLVGDTLMLLLNAHHEAIPFTLPAANPGQHWECLIDSAGPQAEAAAKEQYALQGRSVVVLRTQRAEEAGQVVAGAQAEAMRQETQSPPQEQALSG